VMALVLTVAADTASAQLIFKKIKQRRREELRAEIHAQLSDELTTKMDNDIAREMKIATDTISKAADVKVAAESKKLNQQYSTAVTVLRKESADRFTAESKKLGQQTASGIAAVQKTGLEIADANKAFQASLTAGNSKFQASLMAGNSKFQAALAKQFTEFGVAQELAFNAHTKSFQEKLDAQLKLNQDQIGRSEVLQTEIAKAIDQMDQTTIDMVTTVDDRLATIDEEIQNEVKKQLPEEEPEEEQPAPEPPPAATSSPVKLESDEDDE